MKVKIAFLINLFSILYFIYSQNIVHAQLASKALMATIIELVAKIITALGAVYGVMGVVHYAEANSDGDGPAKKKAVAQMASAVMLIVLSIKLIASATTIAQMVGVL